MQRSCARSHPAPLCAPPLRRPRSRCPAAVASSRRELYPELPSPRVVGTLAVDSPHFLYYEEHGNPGAPRPQQRGDDPHALRFLTLTDCAARSGRACAGGARRAWRGVFRHARALLRPQACVLRAPRLRMSRALCALPALPALRLTRPARADYRIVLLDQRGCGRSAPLGCLDGNNTDALVHPFSSLSHKQRD